MDKRIYSNKSALTEAFAHYLAQLITEKLSTPLGIKKVFIGLYLEEVRLLDCLIS